MRFADPIHSAGCQSSTKFEETNVGLRFISIKCEILSEKCVLNVGERMWQLQRMTGHTHAGRNNLN